MRKSVEDRFWAKINKNGLGGCWIWTAGKVGTGRYGRIYINSKHYRTHRISWELHNGPIPAGIWVLHHCDNPPCVNPAHLFLGTALDNNRDAIRKGRKPPIPQKLTRENVIEIRDLTGPITLREIAARYGVSYETIGQVLRRETWKHA